MTGAAFWRGRRVLLTGHTGFKGAWLALWLAELGAEVHGLSGPPPSEPLLYDQAGVRDVLAGGDVDQVPLSRVRSLRDEGVVGVDDALHGLIRGSLCLKLQELEDLFQPLSLFAILDGAGFEHGFQSGCG